jgi:hypothetical protein
LDVTTIVRRAAKPTQGESEIQEQKSITMKTPLVPDDFVAPANQVYPGAAAMVRTVEITSIERSSEGSTLLDKMSYRVAIADGDKKIVVEARVPLGTLETLSDPSKYVEDFFKTGPMPQATVIDIP